MSNRPHTRPQRTGTPGQATPGVMFCLACCVEAKAAIAAGAVSQPVVLPAVTWAPGPGGGALPTCWEHLTVAAPSKLAGADGRPLARMA